VTRSLRAVPPPDSEPLLEKPEPPAARTRCFVADDHPAILDAVCRWIELHDQLELVGSAVDGQRAITLITQSSPDVALLDIRMPGATGVEITRRLRDAEVTTGVIVYTGNADHAMMLEALDAGARGFLFKEAPLDDLLRAILVVAAGGTYIDPTLAGALIGASPGAAERRVVLTKREREILRMLADGMRNEQVARELAISPLTVRTHVRNAMSKLGAQTRTQAIAEALRQSLIS
jgi:DNA-binding NarL/FixJ family response regulator